MSRRVALLLKIRLENQDVWEINRCMVAINGERNDFLNVAEITKRKPPSTLHFSREFWIMYYFLINAKKGNTTYDRDNFNLKFSLNVFTNVLIKLQFQQCIALL